MSDAAGPSGPLAFDARFPPEARFAATAAEISARLAAAAGCSPDSAAEIRGAIDGAFREALSTPGATTADIELTLRTTDGAFDADLSCRGAGICHCSQPRTE